MKIIDAKKIKELRTQRRMSQQELAKLVGVSDRAISKWELGYSQPSATHLVELTRIFDVGVDEFLPAAYSLKRAEPIGMKSLKELYKIGRGPSSS